VQTELSSSLFVDNPKERWENSRHWLGTKLSETGFVSDICGPNAEHEWMPSRDGKPLGRGSLNAWLVTVGPNGGGQPKNPHQERLRALPRLVIGRPHPYFVEGRSPGYWENMLGESGLVTLFFRNLGIDHEAALGLTFLCNLFPIPGRPPLKSELVHGGPAVLNFLKVSHAKCILALTRDTFEILQEEIPRQFEGARNVRGDV